MIDIHCHILPWIDDGPDSLEESVEMARIASDAGTRTIIATPHINDTYSYPADSPAMLANCLQTLIERSGIELQIEVGREVAIPEAMAMDEDELRASCLGDSAYLLLESPYHGTAQLVRRAVFEMQLRGVRPVLAHPERSPAFVDDLPALEELVHSGALVSITASSLLGRSGPAVESLTREMLRAGLVHNICSDGHGTERRRPDLARWKKTLGGYQGLEELIEYTTVTVPEAILRGHDIPPVAYDLRRRRGPAGRRRRAGAGVG